MTSRRRDRTANLDVAATVTITTSLTSGLIRSHLALILIVTFAAASSNLHGQSLQLDDRGIANSGTTGVASTSGIVSNSSAPYSSLGYHVIAYKPHDTAKVRVDVSLSKQQVYVMEGDRCLLAAACCVGIPDKPTPKGHFRIIEKISNKRSGSYGYQVNEGEATPCLAANCQGKYVGYPMPFWCEFMPGYGFYQGYVWPTPHTHGVIRLDKQVAPVSLSSFNAGLR